MKVIKLLNNNVHIYRSAIILDLEYICFFKNGLSHRKDGPAYINFHRKYNKLWWYYNGEEYGRDNEFNVKTWKEKVQELKLEIFK